MTKAEQVAKELEIIGWMQKKKYDRKISQMFAPIMFQYLSEQQSKHEQEAMERRAYIEDLENQIKQLEIDSHTNDLLIKQLDEYKQVLHGVYNLCDNDNPTHEHIWTLVYHALH